MYISNLLLSKQRQLFVGRTKELSLLHKLATDQKAEWKLLNIYGPSGIGKSTLLRIFAETLGYSRYLYIDGHSGLGSPEDALIHMELYLQNNTSVHVNEVSHSSFKSVVDAINRHALENDGFIILFDTFEQLAMIEEWLRTQFIPALHPYVKVCFAGRYPLEGAWLRDGWQTLIQNVKLQPLSTKEVKKYAGEYGIVEQSTIAALTRFSHGLPLTLSMACEVIQRKGNSKFLNTTEQQQIMSTLVTELIQTIQHPEFLCFLEVATVVWRFDQDLLEAVLCENVSVQSFLAFCKLPFVTRLDDYWLLHDSIRQWVAQDLQLRKPETYQLYRQRALSVLIERETETTTKLGLSIDKMYLHEDPFVRNLCFSMANEYVSRECREEDLAEVEKLFFKFMQHKSITGSSDLQLGYMLRPLWYADPSSIHALWKEDELVAFCTCIPLNPETIGILAQSPITSAVVKNYHPSNPQYLISMAAYNPELENEISGALARAVIPLLSKKAVFLSQCMMTNWEKLMTLLGFQRAPWGHAISADGIKYSAFEIDLRQGNFRKTFDRNIESYKSMPTFSDTQKKIRKMLKHYSHLHNHEDLVRSLSFILPEIEGTEPIEFQAYQLQGRIEFTLDYLCNGPEEDRIFSQIIRLSYIDRIGTHELIAERLNLSVPTYYRYLRKAISRLVFVLINHDPS